MPGAKATSLVSSQKLISKVIVGIVLAFVLVIQGHWKGIENYDFSAEGVPSVRKCVITGVG